MYAFIDMAKEHFLTKNGEFLPLPVDESDLAELLLVSRRQEAEAVAITMCRLGCHVRPYAIANAD